MRDRATVDTTILLRKLLDIEKAVTQKETHNTILDRVLDAEHCLLEMQKESVERRGHGSERKVISFADLPIQ
jgi:hypothetical protein